MSALLEINGLTKRFGGVTAINDAAMTISVGELHAMIGPNGAGKSTLVGLISGFLHPDAGSVLWQGQNMVGHSPLDIARAGISRTFQAATPLRDLSTLDNILVGLHGSASAGLIRSVFRSPAQRREERKLRERGRELVKWVGLEGREDADAGALTFGELRFLEIARCMAVEPQLLLLDEPAAGLNRQETDRLAALLDEISTRGIAVLLIDHDVRFIFATCSHVTVMDYGVVIADGAPADIRNDPAVRAAYLGGG